MKIKNFNQYRINEDDSSGEVIHKLYSLHQHFKPNEGIHKSELEKISRMKDENYLIDDEIILDEHKKKLYCIIIYLICDELLKNPDELEFINKWRAIYWWINVDSERITVDLLTENGVPLKTLTFTFDEVQYPLGYKNLKKFDL